MNENSGINTPEIVALSNFRDYTQIEEEMKPRGTNNNLLILLKLTGADGKPTVGMIDSGCSEMIVQEKVMNTHQLLNRKLGHKYIETVGGNRELKACYSVAVPIIDKTYNFQEVRALAVKKVVSDLPEQNFKNLIDKAYIEYMEQYSKQGQATPYTRMDFPNGIYGGSSNPIDFLIGLSSITLDIIFKYKGLTFYKTNINTGSCPSIVFGGRFTPDENPGIENNISTQSNCMAIIADQKDTIVCGNLDIKIEHKKEATKNYKPHIIENQKSFSDMVKQGMRAENHQIKELPTHLPSELKRKLENSKMLTVPPDGACFRTCINLGMNKQTSTEDLTAQLYEVMQNDTKKFFTDFARDYPHTIIHSTGSTFEAQDEEDFHRFRSTPTGRKTWSDSDEIQAAASLYNLQITIHKITDQNKFFTVIIEPNPEQDMFNNQKQQKKPIELLLMANHYNLIIKNEKTNMAGVTIDTEQQLPCRMKLPDTPYETGTTIPKLPATKIVNQRFAPNRPTGKSTIDKSVARYKNQSNTDDKFILVKRRNKFHSKSSLNQNQLKINSTMSSLLKQVPRKQNTKDVSNIYEILGTSKLYDTNDALYIQSPADKISIESNRAAESTPDTNDALYNQSPADKISIQSNRTTVYIPSPVPVPSIYSHQDIQTNDIHEEGVHEGDTRTSNPAHVDQGMSDITKGGKLTATSDNRIGPKNTPINPPALDSIWNATSLRSDIIKIKDNLESKTTTNMIQPYQLIKVSFVVPLSENMCEYISEMQTIAASPDKQISHFTLGTAFMPALSVPLIVTQIRSSLCKLPTQTYRLRISHAENTEGKLIFPVKLTNMENIANIIHSCIPIHIKYVEHKQELKCNLTKADADIQSLKKFDTPLCITHFDIKWMEMTETVQLVTNRNRHTCATGCGQIPNQLEAGTIIPDQKEQKCDSHTLCTAQTDGTKWNVIQYFSTLFLPLNCSVSNNLQMAQIRQKGEWQITELNKDYLKMNDDCKPVMKVSQIWKNIRKCFLCDFTSNEKAKVRTHIVLDHKFLEVYLSHQNSDNSPLQCPNDLIGKCTNPGSIYLKHMGPQKAIHTLTRCVDNEWDNFLLNLNIFYHEDEGIFQEIDYYKVRQSKPQSIDKESKSDTVSLYSDSMPSLATSSHSTDLEECNTPEEYITPPQPYEYHGDTFNICQSLHCYWDEDIWHTQEAESKWCPVSNHLTIEKLQSALKDTDHDLQNNNCLLGRAIKMNSQFDHSYNEKISNENIYNFVMTIINIEHDDTKRHGLTRRGSNMLERTDQPNASASPQGLQPARRPPTLQHQKMDNTDEQALLVSTTTQNNQDPKVNNIQEISTSATSPSKLNQAQVEAIREIMKSFLDPSNDPTNRCSSCAKCMSCGPAELMSIQAKKDIARTQENDHLKKSIAIARDENNPGKMKIIATLPVDINLVKEKLSANNLADVTQEYDRKMRSLSIEDKSQMETEFQKLKNLGYFIAINELPQVLQDDIWSSDVINFLSVSPAYKKASLSTCCRAAVNGSKKQRKSNLSINDLSLTGLAPLDITATFRHFKSQAGAAVADIRKFYNQVHIARKSWPLQLMLWRKDCDRNNPLEYLVITRLQYGLRSSATLSRLGLEIICSYGENSCNICNGQYSVFNESTSPECPGISHAFSNDIKFAYVDDIIFSQNTQERTNEVATYGTNLLSLFSYEFKGINRPNEEHDPASETLDSRGELLLAGYRYKPSSDTFTLKYPTHTNGIKFRGKTIPQDPKTGRKIPINATQKRIQELEERFIHRELTTTEEITVASLHEIYKDSKKTLRLMVALAAKPYDVVGISAPLIAQMRKSVSTGMKETQGVWEKEIPSGLWQVFLKQLIEIDKLALYNYPRIPPLAVTNGSDVTLIVSTDASTSQIYCAHLIYNTKDGNKAGSLLLARSYIGSETQTIPKSELQSLSRGATMLRKLTEELKSTLSNIYIFCDSLVSIFWTISQNRTQIYVENRTDNIKQKLNEASEILQNYKKRQGKYKIHLHNKGGKP